MHVTLALLTSSLLGLAAPTAAQVPYLVKDIHTLQENVGSQPDYLGVLDGVAFFRADDGRTGQEIWRTNGTENGTWQVADICPGECSSNIRPLLITPAGFFFSANSVDSRQQLWVTRGEPSSTFQLTTDLHAIYRSPQPVWDNRRKVLFFAAADARDKTLWRSAGTPAGTHQVADVSLLCDYNDPVPLTLFAGKVYFCGDDGDHGPSLWVTNGTARGTRRIKSFDDSSGKGGPRSLRVFGRLLVFIQGLPSREVRLWRSDGTPQGTVPVAGLGLRKESEIDSSLIVGSRLFFTIAFWGDPGVTPSLWVTDGTTQGTRKLGSFPKGGVSLPGFALGKRVLFPAFTRRHGSELWTTDGTPAGTRLVKDFCPGRCSGSVFPLRLYKNRTLLSVSSPGRGRELWTTDGTTAGTRLLRDLCSGSCSSDPWVLGEKDGRLLFVANNSSVGIRREIWSTDGTPRGTVQVSRLGPEGYVGSALLYGSAAALPTGFLFIGSHPFYGYEPWFTDGTTAGTRLVRDVASLGNSSDPARLMRLGEEIFFFAQDGLRGFELWKSDGTDAGTRLVTELVPGPGPDLGPYILGHVEVGDHLFFLLDSGLWRTDGTEAGTLQISPRARGQLAKAGNLAFFTERTENGFAVWASDGTWKRTRQVAGPSSTEPVFFTAFQGRLYFSTGEQLWACDGTPEGTAPLPLPEPLATISQLTVHKGFLYFFAGSETQGLGLWRTDGTSNGTVLAVELDGATPDRLLSAGERLFFSDYTGLWVSDGTAAGTVKIGDPSFGLGWTTVFRGVLYVSYFGQLWKSDGTSAGTELLDLELEGQTVGGPLVAFGDHLYGLTEGSLVETDGTPAGTRLVRPPSPLWSIPNPGFLFSAGSHLFFTASDADTGRELWALPL